MPSITPPDANAGLAPAPPPAEPSKRSTHAFSSQPTQEPDAPTPRYRPCSDLTDRGLPCRFPARTSSDRCVNHDPGYAATRRANAVAGGLASGQARKPIPLSEVHLDFLDRAGIQAALEAVVRLEMVGRISPARSRNILRALSIAQRNFDRDAARPAGSDRRDRQESVRYYRARRDISRNLAAVTEEAALRDTPQPTSLPGSTRPRVTERLWNRIDKLLQEPHVDQ